MNYVEFRLIPYLFLPQCLNASIGNLYKLFNAKKFIWTHAIIERGQAKMPSKVLALRWRHDG
jgi:hypothetical protein